MRLSLEDGYTLSDELKPKGPDEIELPTVNFSYRPAMPEAIYAWEFSRERATDGKLQHEIDCQFLCDHLASWDVTKGAQLVAPITLEFVKKLPEPYLVGMIRIVRTWAPKRGEAEKNFASA